MVSCSVLKLAVIEARIAYMELNFSGCDWCCGGGDEEMRELMAEKKELLAK